MSFPRYPEYKDSGVEWLGGVPAHWEVLPTKRAFAVIGGSTPKSDDPTYWDGDICWVTPADLSRLSGLEITESLRTITEAGLASCGTSLVPTGSVILSTRAPIGSLGIAAIPICTNQGCKALVPSGHVDSRFMAYVLGVSTAALNIRGKGTTFLELSGDELAAFRIPAPSFREQTAIAAFLDRETAKIDALVAEQETLIALLKEKRQAVISHAVTKGLNPDAPMKPSGIEWLGDVPAHWEILKASRLFRAKKGSNAALLTKEYCSLNVGDYPVYSGQTDGEGVMGSFNDYEFDVGDEGALLSTTVGAKAMSLIHIYGKFSLSQNCMVILGADDSMSVRFWLYQLQTLFQFERGLIPDHMQPSFRMDDFYQYRVALPPATEQRNLATYLDRECERFDSLLSLATENITLLKERRSALISAAVTGQIDVRGLAAPAEAA
ncbi:MAG: restriction endonuclease subunit S [Polycyclovorans sp.]|jgi:type I restriction enzyme, S subunit|nr:restriction endonuclease subunit S [Polycyclovorans sp.]